MVKSALVLAALATSAYALRQKALEDNACSTLHNEGSFSTVDVEVGTPPQKLSIVADTGSDLFLVESCACEDTGACEKDGKCFRGAGGASTTYAQRSRPEHATIHYGSGPIDTEVATDEVRVGGIRAQMTDSLMLIDKNRLKHGLKLSGILGLGLPHQDDASIAKQKGFLDKAHVPRFAMCFNQNGRDGVLRMGSTIEMERPLQGVGTQHWGVDFRGITVGGHGGGAADLLAVGEASPCSAEVPGQDTPCGAIVDSGTTLILAPKEHLAQLFAQICDAWPKCRGEMSPSLLEVQGQEAEQQLMMTKARSFLEQMASCEEVASMPTLQFHMRGKDGTKDTLSLEPNDYVMQSEANSHLAAYLGVQHTKKVCQPAFEVHEMNTLKNGPVYLLGTPFFYKYNVAYDRSTSPPAISFNRGGCGSCAGGGAAANAGLLQEREWSASPPLRHLDTEPRVNFFNVSVSL